MKTKLIIRLGIQLMVLAGCAKEEIKKIPIESKGCTDTCSLNYDPEAFVDDGSCRLPGDLSEKLSAGTWIITQNFAMTGRHYYPGTSNEYWIANNDTAWSNAYDSLRFIQGGQMELYKSNGEIDIGTWSIYDNNKLKMPPVGFEKEMDFLIYEYEDCWILVVTQYEILGGTSYYETYWEHHLVISVL